MNNLSTYTQCMWNANGELSCQKVQFNKVNTPDKYTMFHDFSTPTKNYKPNEYRSNMSYYEKPNNTNECGKLLK